MKYSELIDFEPIESVVQLVAADESRAAARLVETFVISESMADNLANLVFPQLQFDKPADNKGLLIVGNYGTGKSHLMAVISAIAEHGALASHATNARVAEAAASIAGRFVVLRAEIGATTMGLRDIVCRNLEEKLAELGVDYEFPPADEVTNNKDALVQMMAKFEESFPDQGLLLALDELLDYLRSRDEQELILDLNFLREVGEVCRATRFRFFSGVQESLFDAPRFQFVAETLRRVKDRFEQVRIAREDVAYVVSQRLLKKSAEQAGRIREHLTQFAPLYSSMNEQMDTFVELFPVHPAYLDTFEKVYVAEKREVLKTLSEAIRGMLDASVPQDAPGLIAYDSYWNRLKGNPSFRSVPEIKDVVDKSKVLEDRIVQAYTQPAYKSVAIRIIHALSVHRLTTDDIYAPLGATPAELRDDLCLILPTPERDAVFLETLIEKALSEILKTVSGQFITVNRENNQYYLDLKKDVDFDSLVAKKADTLSPDQLDRHYFAALTRVMEATDTTYVTGYKIWEHELEWREKKAERSGYLFFGAPNERSTAQPPRDFYLYFLQPHDPPVYKDEKKSDEVFFGLTTRDDEFDTALKLYAGASEQAVTASGENKRIYEQKAAEHLRALTRWLQAHMTTAFHVTHQGRSRSLQEVIQGKVAGGTGNASVRDLVNVAGAVCLAPEFQNKSPDYPAFSVLVTAKNREQAATEALKWIAGGVKSKPGTAILDALQLLDGEYLQPRQSPFANHVLEALNTKKKGQVLNRAELVQEENGIDYWTRFRLEPEFLAVVLAALVHAGVLVISIPGRKLGAESADGFSSIPISDLANFKHVERPKGIQLEPLKELFKILGLSEGKLVAERTRDAAVQDLQVKVAAHVEKLVMAYAHLQDGLAFWGRPVLADPESADWKAKLSGAKSFLESLQAFNTPGKLANFPHDVDAVKAQQPALELVSEVEELVAMVQQVAPMVSYLSTAEAILPADHAWLQDVDQAKAELFTKVASSKHRADPGFRRTLSQRLAELKKSYQDAYLVLHQRAHLGAKDGDTKDALGNDARLKQLQKLDAVELMPHQQLKAFQNTLFGLRACPVISRQDIDQNPVCPHTQFRPVEAPPGAASASDTLAGLDDRLDDLVGEWTRTLLGNLEDPTVGPNIELITDPKGKGELEQFMKRKRLPDPVSEAFVKALQEALTGLEKVVIEDEALLAALTAGGMPCTVDELQERFRTYVAGLTKGKNTDKTRVVVE